MFVYLDESGDAGFKFRQGSSRYFVVTLLLVNDPLPFHQAIDQLRVSLGFERDNEFKWVNSSKEVRWAFLRIASFLGTPAPEDSHYHWTSFRGASRAYTFRREGHCEAAVS
jgi:hypothetical protein